MSELTTSRALVPLVAATALLALGAAGLGLFLDGGARIPIDTLRSGAVELYGVGLYRYDSVLIGSGFRGVDAVVLFVALPLLAISTALTRRGSLRAALVLGGVLALFVYQYASLAFGAAYNELFLVYVALFSLSSFALIHALTSFDARAVDAALSARLPRRTIGGFLVASGVVIGLAWLPPVIAPLSVGATPDVLAHYTTMPTWVLDLGLVAPTLVVAGVLLWRRRAAGVVLSAAVLVLAALMGPLLGAMTVSQLAAGVSFTAAEVVAFIASFGVLSAISCVMLALLLRHVRADRR